MKGFNRQLTKLLSKGLRADSSNLRNEEGLVECYNLKPHILGLKAYEPLDNPFSSEVPHWPFPQMFVGSKYNIFASNSSIYEIDSSWNLTLGVASSAGVRWDMIDFGDYLVFCNGTKLVVRDSTGAYTSNDSFTTMPLFSTGCNFKGQIVAGNIKSTWYDCDSSFVIWGNIGSIDMTVSGSNVAGYRPLPWGEVLKVMRLGETVIAYCERGVGVLAPYNQTFGFKELLSIGIPCKSAVGGDDQSHMFIDTENYLWTISSDLKLQRLGYQEFMESLDPEMIVVTLNTSLREFYISDGVNSYLLTPYGLCKVFQCPTTMIVVDKEFYGIYNISDSDEVEEALIVTDILDFGVKGMKTIESLEVGISASYDKLCYGAIDYNYETTGEMEFSRSDWKRLNLEGQCAPLVTAPQIRIAVKCENYEEVKIDSLSVGIKFPDKRFKAASYASEIATRSN